MFFAASFYFKKHNYKMSEDLISNNFVDNINRTIIKRTIRVSKAVLILTILYAIAELVVWYTLIARSINFTDLSRADFYDLRITPVIAVLLLTSSIISWLYCVKANKLTYLSFENNDADLFNKAYLFFYRSARLIFASFALATLSVSIRILLNELK